MSGTPQQKLFTLHRYFMTAHWMRRRFYVFVREHPGFASLDDEGFPEYFAYMSLWYSTLWMVLDGWLQMDINAPAVSALLADEQHSKLKDFAMPRCIIDRPTSTRNSVRSSQTGR